MSSSQSFGSSPTAPSNIFFFIAMGVGGVLVTIFSVVGLRHYYNRRRRAQMGLDPYSYNAPLAPLRTVHDPNYSNRPGVGDGTYPYAIGANGSRRGRVVRRKKPLKLMTRAQIDAQFPVKAFSEAKLESQLSYKGSNKTDLSENSEKNAVTSTITSSFEDDSEKSQSVTVNELRPQSSISSTTGKEKSWDFESQHMLNHHQHLNLNLKSKHHSLLMLSQPGRNSSKHSLNAKENRRSLLSSLGMKFGGSSENVNNTQASSRPVSQIEDLDSGAFVASPAPVQHAAPSRFSTPVFGTQYHYDDENDDENDEGSSSASEIEESDSELDMPTPSNADDSDISTCAICIEDMEDADLVRGLTCGHIFHADCIEPWLLNRSACCPLCKKDYYAPNTVDPLGPEPIEEVPTSHHRTNSTRRSHRRRSRRAGNSTTTTTVQVIGESNEQPRNLNASRSTTSLNPSVFSFNRMFRSRSNLRLDTVHSMNEAESDPRGPSDRPVVDLNVTPRQLEDGIPRYPEPARV